MAAQPFTLSAEYSKILGQIIHSEQGVVGPVLAKLEEVTKIKRDYFVHGAISIFIAYLVLGRSAELVCNLIGFVYPAYASIKAIQSADTRDDTHWLTYWTVFAFFSVLEFASDQIVGWFPFYWLTKFMFLIWLYLPMTRGAEVVYNRFIVPLMDKYGERLAEIEEEIKQQLQHPESDNDKVQDDNKHSSDNHATIPNGDSVLEPDVAVDNEKIHHQTGIPPVVTEENKQEDAFHNNQVDPEEPQTHAPHKEPPSPTNPNHTHNPNHDDKHPSPTDHPENKDPGNEQDPKYSILTPIDDSNLTQSQVL